VDKLAFTGSTETGKIVLDLATKSNLKGAFGTWREITLYCM